MQRIAIIVAAIALLAGGAQAQVATTDFVPAAPRFIHPFGTGFNTGSIAPDNPAALAWGQPSRVALSAHRGTHTDNQAGQEFNFDGTLVGLRLAGETFGVAVEQQTTKEDVEQDQATAAHGSLNVGDWLGLGVGKEVVTREVSGLEAVKVDRQAVGLSLRLAENFYVGFGRYRDTVDVFGDPTQYKRDIDLYGVALRTQGAVAWYLAYDVIDQKALEPGPIQGGAKSSAITVQVRYNAILLGASVNNTEIDNSFGGGPNEAKLNTLDVGWAPAEGLAVTARVQKSELRDTTAGGNTDETVQTRSVALAWQF